MSMGPTNEEIWEMDLNPQSTAEHACEDLLRYAVNLRNTPPQSVKRLNHYLKLEMQNIKESNKFQTTGNYSSVILGLATREFFRMKPWSEETKDFSPQDLSAGLELIVEAFDSLDKQETKTILDLHKFCHRIINYNQLPNMFQYGLASA